MLFQTLDDKKECFGIYCNGVISYDTQPKGISKTWNYSSHLANKSIEYAQLYCEGASLDAACPAELKPELQAVTDRMKAYLRSFEQSKISLNEHCFYSLVPERFLVELCEIKNKISEHVLATYVKPKNYDFMLKISSMIGDIANTRLSVDKEPLRNHLGSIRGRNLWNAIDSLPPYVRYNAYGTKTGRLSTTKNSFPVLTLNKAYRGVLAPVNDWFVELDFNAAELRTLLALSGHTQPAEDLHMWNARHLYKETTREDAKQRIFAWLYNPEAKGVTEAHVYKRGDVLSKHWDGCQVTTPFDRVIGADKKHALNYLIQSTSSDVFMDRACAVHDFLLKRRSHISMLIHDSVVLDISKEDLSDLKEIVDIFSDTCYGKYKVGVSVGKNFGEMRSIR